MDFSKAFDVVPHKRLLEKLQYYGIKGSCLDWNRSQRIVVDGECSEEAAVTSRVPQGSVLDQSSSSLSKCRLFTDDSIIYRKVKSIADCDQLQQDLDSLHEWETLWGMSFGECLSYLYLKFQVNIGTYR